MTEQTIDRNKLLDMWCGGAPAKEIAGTLKCSTSSIYRIVNHAFFEDGDNRGAPQTQEMRDMWRAHRHIEKIAEMAAKGIEVSAIGAKFGLKDHIVRASIYIATQAGYKTGFVMGA